ncbi:unnamed protein product [Prunus armeniaca]
MRLAEYIEAMSCVMVSLDAMFDVHTKQIHEYKKGSGLIYLPLSINMTVSRTTLYLLKGAIAILQQCAYLVHLLVTGMTERLYSSYIFEYFKRLAIRLYFLNTFEYFNVIAERLYSLNIFQKLALAVAASSSGFGTGKRPNPPRRPPSRLAPA